MAAAALALALLGTALSGFVKARGPDLYEGDRPFRFVGANLRVMHGARWRVHYDEVLAQAARDGLRVGRIWALGEGEPDAEPWRRQEDLFRAGPEGWIDEAYLQLDRVLAAARRHGVRLIVTLSNHWKDYGGAPQYLRWIGIDELDEIFGSRDHFYSDPRIRAAYAAHVERLLARKNSLDGTPYVDEPAILAWELMNESQVESVSGAAARRAWVAWAAGLIKARDRNHLVGPGLLGYPASPFPEERAEWIATHRLPEIDYCDAHLYPRSSLRVRTPADLDAFIDDLAQLARYVVRKPLVIGEFGVPTQGASFRGLPVVRWIDRLLARARLDELAGALIWIYEPNLGASDDYGVFTDDLRAAPIRRSLARAAALAAAEPEASGPRNPALGPARGETPLLDFHVELPGRATPLDRWTPEPAATGRPPLVLELPPEGYARARWEHVGTWAGGAVVHTYGARTGYFEYRFRRPSGAAGPPAALELRARLSSEYPGAVSPSDGVSRVDLLVDGRRGASFQAFPDDGRGRWYTVTIDDPQLLAPLGRGGVHALRLEVAPGPEAHGVCIYGGPGRQGGVPDAAPALLRWRPATAGGRAVYSARPPGQKEAPSP